jgi:hypothetical protein
VERELFHRERTLAQKIREQHPSSAQPAKRQPLIDRLNVFHLIEHHRNFTLIQQGMCDP